MPFIFNESPDRMRIDAMTALDFDRPEAHTFCFPSRNTLATSRRPHTYIFNALTKAVADLPGQRKHFKDYEAKLHGRLDAEGAKEARSILFDGDLPSGMGARRRRSLAGRAWVNVRNGVLGRFHAMSFWGTEKELQAAPWIFPLLVQHFKLTGAPIYFEGIDSKQPRIYRDFMTDLEDTDGGGLKSTVAPHLTSEQIADILVKAHVAPFTLTPLEREVAYEFRGRPTPKKYAHKFPTDAEFNAVRIAGESWQLFRRGLLNPPDVSPLAEDLLHGA